MKDILVLLLVYLISVINALDCSKPANSSSNPDDYRSFYVCDNQCPSLNYCQSPQFYFSNETKSCVSEPNNWIPRYYLSGTTKPSPVLAAILYVRQDGYQLLWTFDDSSTSETFNGRYINETRIQGVNVRRLLITNCISVFDVEITATADRTYCATHRLHPQSALCDLSYPYEFEYCRTLSV